MIISHRHRFIFAAVPKTGTHAVRRALREQMGEQDLEQVGLFVEKRFPWPELAAIGHGHVSLRQIRPCVGEDAFSGYCKFAFVRNPFDRFISYCAFMLRHTDVFQRSPRDALYHFAFSHPDDSHILFRPQTSLLADDDGQTLLTDEIGRVEDMQNSYDAICARIGIPSQALERVNASTHGDYRRYYDQRLAEAVARRYAADLALFGYTFDGLR